MNDSEGLSRSASWLLWATALVAAGAGGLCAVLVGLWLLPRGHGAVWEWPLRETPVTPLPFTLPAVGALLIVALISLDLLRAGKTPSRLACAALVICLTLGSGALMVSMALDDSDFAFRASAAVLGDNSMGYYLQALKVGRPGEYLRDVQARTTLGLAPQRVATHPPGPVLYAWAARRWLSARPALLDRLRTTLERWTGDKDLEGTLILARRVATFGPGRDDIVLSFWPAAALTLLAPLVIPLAFGMGALAVDRRVGLIASVFAAATPSLLCFAPSVDGLGAVMAGAVIVTWLWAMNSGRWLPPILCGALWMSGLFWSFGLVALAPVLLVAGLAWRSESGERPRHLPAVVGLGLGFFGLGVAGLLGLGYDTATSMIHSLDAQREIMALTHRPYRLSAIWNLYEFALFAGPAVIVMAAVGTVLGFARRGSARTAGALGLGVVVTLAGLALAGRTRGEVGRIWGFLMPILSAPAALPITRLRGWGLIGAGLLILAGQIALAVAINTYWSLVAP